MFADHPRYSLGTRLTAVSFEVDESGHQIGGALENRKHLGDLRVIEIEPSESSPDGSFVDVTAGAYIERDDGVQESVGSISTRFLDHAPD